MFVAPVRLGTESSRQDRNGEAGSRRRAGLPDKVGIFDFSGLAPTRRAERKMLAPQNRPECRTRTHRETKRRFAARRGKVRRWDGGEVLGGNVCIGTCDRTGAAPTHKAERGSPF